MLRCTLIGSALLAASLGFSGCSDSDSDVMSAETTPMYEISVTNLTAGQAMAPAIATLHNADYKMYMTGESASLALENLAEGGDNSALLAAADATTDVDEAVSFGGLLTPGATLSVTLEGDDAYLSFAGMLVNTNDGFVGLNSYHISHLSEGEVETISLSTYDAGTEANSETAATMPGQSGEGFNATRDDVNDKVRYHSGVVTSDDGLAASALSGVHRFDNPTAMLTIKRVH